MNTFKKTLIYIGIGILFIILGIGIYIYTSGPKLPDDTDKIIEEVITNPLPELIEGKSGFANSNGIKIWFEDILPNKESKGVVLLIMGISNDALGWPQKFIESFTDAGYRVIRYDHRGTGLSDWLEDFDNKNPYSLSDMAFDAVSVLDTLTSVMSSGDIFDQNISPISSEVAYDLIEVAIKYSIFNTDKNMIKLHLASRIILMGEASSQLNIKELSEQVLYNIRKRKGYNPNVSKQHQAAVSNSVSRYDDLRTLKTRTLIIHGKDDPFIPIEHSKKCVNLIPNVDSLWVDNMGHDIPNELIPIITQKIMDNFIQPLD